MTQDTGQKKPAAKKQHRKTKSNGGGMGLLEFGGKTGWNKTSQNYYDLKGKIKGI